MAIGEGEHQHVVDTATSKMGGSDKRFNVEFEILPRRDEVVAKQDKKLKQQSDARPAPARAPDNVI